MPTDPATADAALASCRRWLERAAVPFPNPEAVYEANRATLRRLGPEGGVKVPGGGGLP